VLVSVAAHVVKDVGLRPTALSDPPLQCGDPSPLPRSFTPRVIGGEGAAAPPPNHSRGDGASGRATPRGFRPVPRYRRSTMKPPSIVRSTTSSGPLPAGPLGPGAGFTDSVRRSSSVSGTAVRTRAHPHPPKVLVHQLPVILGDRLEMIRAARAATRAKKSLVSFERPDR
jgi:hypothetical protein